MFGYKERLQQELDSVVPLFHYSKRAGKLWVLLVHVVKISH